MRWMFWRKPPCKHEWVIGKPTDNRRFPAVCRWCNARVTLDWNEAHIHKEWQRLEIERTKWPAEDGAKP